MILVLLGAPGSGKGTQSKKLVTEKGWPQLSTGDMFRAAISQKTPVGLKAKSYMDKGDLVPDEVVIGIVEERIRAPDCKKGFILDGFPRTIPQAEALDRVLENNARSVGRVVFFQISDDFLVSRLSGRRSCTKCGAMFHLETAPPKKAGVCDACGHSPLVQRDDDQPAVIQKRLQVYRDQTAPLKGYYERQKKLYSIDATLAPDQVYENLLSALK